MKWILIPLLVFASITSIAQELPVRDFVRHGDYLDMKLSPDGKHIAARVRVDNRVMMAIFETATMKPVGGLKPANNDIIHTVSWISNERLVFEYAEKQGNFDAPVATGELYATNIDNGKRLMIYGYRAGDDRTGSRISNREDNYASQEVISLLEGDDKHILIIEHPWTKESNVWYDSRKKQPIISKLNVYNGKKRKVEVLPYDGASVLANKSGSINYMRWRDKTGEFHSAYRKSEDDDWETLVVESADGHELFPRGLSEDEKYVYLSGGRGDDSVYTLYALELATGEVTEIFEAHATDIENYINDDNGMPAVGVTYPGKSEYVYAQTKSRTAKIHKMLVDAFGGQTVVIASRTQDGKTLLVHVSSDVNPGEYFLFDRDTLSAQFLWANNSWIDPRQLAPVKPFTFTTKDDVQLNGYLTLPKQQSEAKPPMVVMIHGGPHQSGTRDFWRYDSEVQLLANRGYAVMQVNFRGSDGYGSTFKKMGYRQWGGKMIDDITESAQWAIEQGYVDGDKVCVYGASYGGYAALMSAVKAPDLYACTVGYVGIYDLEYMFTESDIPNNWGGKEYLRRVLGTDKDELKAYSPIYHADKIKANVMLIHGSQDRRVPEINSEVLYKKLEELGKPPVYLKYKQAGHGVYNEDSRADLYEGLIEFLDRNLKKA